MLGDSTGVGLGAHAGDSIAGLLAAERPDTRIVNLCRVGARLEDLEARLARDEHQGMRFDLALILAGGNDILKGRSMAQIERDGRRLLERLRGVADRIVWLGPADIGRAPVFLPPLSWWLSWRTSLACARLQACAARHQCLFIDFSNGPYALPLKKRGCGYFAPDGVHPARESYRYCYAVLKTLLATPPIAGEDDHSHSMDMPHARQCEPMSGGGSGARRTMVEVGGR